MHNDTRQMIHEALRRAGKHQLSQRQLAAQAHVDPATITKLIYGMRPTVETLKALVRAWPEREDRLSILCAHLRDEIARSGTAESDITITHAGDADEPVDISQAITELRRIARHSQPIRDLLIDLAVVVRAADHAEARGAGDLERVAAEPKPQYKIPRRQGAS